MLMVNNGPRLVPVLVLVLLTARVSSHVLMHATHDTNAAPSTVPAALQLQHSLPAYNESIAGHFVELALACAPKTFPNQVKHMMFSDADVHADPRAITPAFHGCLDWHSAAHAHWLLARSVRLFPRAPWAEAALTQLCKSLTEQNIATEAAYVKARPGFERPYGLAWIMALDQELAEAGKTMHIMEKLSKTLEPLARVVRGNLNAWIPKLLRPIRSGEHSNSALGLTLYYDWAASCVARADATCLDEAYQVQDMISAAVHKLYLPDVSCPLAYDLGGQSFLSPCLTEADLVRRVVGVDEYAQWLTRFLDTLPSDGAWKRWLDIAHSPDRSEGKFAHLDGCNLSRAWAMRGVAAALHQHQASDGRVATLLAAADAHARAGLTAVSKQHYMGSHWLGTFAAYLLSERGLHVG